MLTETALPVLILLQLAVACVAQENAASKPAELEVLKASIGIWDADIEVWPAGLDSPSIQFKGVETNRPYGEYWIASDFDSEFMGQTMKVHSIIGFDLDQNKLIGKVVDHGPYAAGMTGEYDVKSKTVTWMTEAKTPEGEPILQKTRVTQTTPDERVLVLMVPGKEKDKFRKFMRIEFVKRK